MIALFAALMISQTEPVGLTTEEIAAYRDALRDPEDSTPATVTFAELWNRPDAYRGRRVRLPGRVVREFRAPASGELPARVEVWIETEDRNLICSVFPESGSSTPITGRVLVCGRSLGQVRYQSGDSVRLAPLIVGPTRPRPLGPGNSIGPDTAWDRAGWIVAAMAAAVVALFLARGFARRPPPVREIPGPGVEFES